MSEALHFAYNLLTAQNTYKSLDYLLTHSQNPSASIEIQNQIMLCLRLRLLNYVTYRNYDSELPWTKEP